MLPEGWFGLLASYLKQRSFYVGIDVGVPQGNVLGRLLLLSFIDYILRNIDKALSADDTCAFSFKFVLYSYNGL